VLIFPIKEILYQNLKIPMGRWYKMDAEDKTKAVEIWGRKY
jgi:hypothetical protein